MKTTNILNLIVPALLISIVATMFYLILFACNGNYIAHFSLGAICVIRWNDGTWPTETQEPEEESDMY